MHVNCDGSMLAVVDGQDVVHLLSVDLAAKSVVGAVDTIPDVRSMVWHAQDPRCVAVTGRGGLRVWQDGKLGAALDGVPASAQLACFEGLSVLVRGCWHNGVFPPLCDITTLHQEVDVHAVSTTPGPLGHMCSMVDLPPLAAIKSLLLKAAPRDAFSQPSAEGKDALAQAQHLAEDGGGAAHHERVSTMP